MKFPSNRTLGKIVVYGAVASISGVMYMRYSIQDRIRNTQYFKSALQTLRQHKGAVSLLGEPIKEIGFDLADEKKNSCDGNKAHFEVSVKGPKDKGTIFFWATRTDELGWVLDKLDLEVKSQPDKRFLIKKADI
ncbi:uncharacterized protein LOC129906231 [Episyrphus balteatus]|uniref:uncharacterized protein LOC129906231 n=1 Tax=Episyrphus balteatus TaxID=286459 RepID=UPI002485E087|nr:uncharacterized protein LOC129906231 [Episyrphus balteatus]